MTVAMDLAQELLACLRTALLTNPVPPPDDKIMLRAGEQVTPMLGTGTDECCTGLAWVRIVGTNPLRTLDEGLHNCFRSQRLIELEMGVARCAPQSSVQTVPTADQWDATALQLDADHDSMEAALCCAYPQLTELGDAAIVGEYAPFGPDGNCIGGTMRVVVEADCGCTGG